MKPLINTLTLATVLVVLAACSDDKTSNNTTNSSQAVTSDEQTTQNNDAQITETPEDDELVEEETAATDIKRGLYVYDADSAQFTDCASGKVYPVAQEKAASYLESTYLAIRNTPQQKLFIEVKGEYDMRPPLEGDDVEMLIPTELLKVVNTDSCS